MTVRCLHCRHAYIPDRKSLAAMEGWVKCAQQERWHWFSETYERECKLFEAKKDEPKR